MASTGSLVTSTSSSSKDNTDNASVISSSKNGDTNEEYHSKLKGLNLAVLEWIKSHLDKNPLVILSPIFKDYEKHLTEIQKSNTASKEKVKIISDFKFDTKPSETSTAGFSFGTPSAKASIETKSQVKGNDNKEADAEPPKSNFSFGAKSTTDEAVKSTFSFGVKSPPNETTKSTFSFGASAPVSSSKTFSFGSKNEENKEKTGFSFGSSEEPKSTFSFGTKTTSSETKPSFSFGSTTSTTDKKDSPAKPAFSFGVGSSNTAPATGFSFSGAAPFSFSGVAPASSSTEPTKEEEEENDEPPKVEFTQVEENDSVYSKKCKVFVKNEDKYGDRGVGTLHLKPVEGQKKTQLIVRADTNLGNLLLNILLNESVPTKRMGKKDVLLVAVPMPTDKKPTQILVRVKTEEEADQLLEALEKYKKQE